MSQVKTSIEIAAPPAVVFAKILDPEHLGDWVTIHRSVKVTTPTADTEGAEMEQVLSLRGVSVTIRWKLVAVEAPHRAEWKGRGPAGSGARIIYALSGPEAGPTRFDYTNEFTAPGGVIGAAASRVVVGGVSEREAQASLAKLKRLLEA